MRSKIGAGLAALAVIAISIGTSTSPINRASLGSVVATPTASAVANAQQAGLKIAFVNVAALMEQAPGKAAAESIFTKEGKTYEAQLKKLDDSLQAMLKKYQDDEPKLTTQAAKEARQKPIQDLNLSLQAKQLEFQKKLQARNEELLAPIQDMVKGVIDEIRQQDGYTIIFDLDPQLAVSYDKNLDITDKMLTRLKTKTPAASGTVKRGGGG